MWQCTVCLKETFIGNMNNSNAIYLTFSKTYIALNFKVRQWSHEFIKFSCRRGGRDSGLLLGRSLFLSFPQLRDHWYWWGGSVNVTDLKMGYKNRSKPQIGNLHLITTFLLICTLEWSPKDHNGKLVSKVVFELKNKLKHRTVKKKKNFNLNIILFSQVKRRNINKIF